ncbi:DEAD/DEAH box helicase [Massilia sp. Root351]|nr:DEAD/DEAH box helicase [Massilia sp. Root351]
MHLTIGYYNQNADSFFSDTSTVDMTALHDLFLSSVAVGGVILDAGCGSGRDSKAFQNRGYRPVAFDASDELARLASQHAGIDVSVRSFLDVREQSCYDGVWACASLLHVARSDIPQTLQCLWASLKPGGTFYLSFKLGMADRVHDGRHFTDANEGQLREWFSTLSDVRGTEYWVTTDQRPGRTEQWINSLVFRSPTVEEKLVTGGKAPFLPHLCSAINQATDIDMAVAFVKTSGLRLLLPDLQSALQRDSNQGRVRARVRILTSDYLDVTDTEALRHLMLLQELGAQVKVYESAGSSFHLKAYLFAGFNSKLGLTGTAFIGSSNISRQALQHGLEWNYRINYPGDNGFLEARSRFDELFANVRSVPLTDAWIDNYEARRVTLPLAVEAGSLEQDPPPKPTSVQTSALAALAETRSEGYRSGLVVLATGLGKTWLAAFDAAQLGAKRILFVAHREEILNQAAETFLRIRPNFRVGFYAGQSRDVEVDVLCASVQTLSRNEHLERFSPYHFDYVVVDEFHHASAATYRRLLAYFTPRFLLGLTATPERSDQSDILSLCDDNLVFTCSLFEGIRSKLLAPFHYYGIFDSSVDYTEIPWRSNRFDQHQLSNKLATLARAKHALREWSLRKQERTLAFCVSTKHADFMEAQFSKAGIACAAVYAGSHMSRGDALERLRDGRLAVIFSVDFFNEGVDLPEIDTVMMLRPTESKILFLQQLGRGLRKSAGKDKLVILDFIGNHKSFLHKPLALFGKEARHLADFARKAQANQLLLPDGCYVNYDLELIDFLKSLDGDGIRNEYAALRNSLGRRPTLAEFYRSGSSMQAMRSDFQSWFTLVEAMDDLDPDEQEIAAKHRAFLREVETTNMTKSFKMVLLEAFQELDGWRNAPTTDELAQRSWRVLQRRRTLLGDLPEAHRTADDADKTWYRYWMDNPIKAWTGANRSAGAAVYFRVEAGRFQPSFATALGLHEKFGLLVQELIDYRLAVYEWRQASTAPADNVVPFRRTGNADSRIELPYFPNLKIACGHFKTGTADAEEYRALGPRHGHLDPERHFIARASGNSMNGGKHPINDGDYLLLEHITPSRAGAITGSVIAIERQDETGEGSQYLLRTVLKGQDGGYILRASNAEYKDMDATDNMRTLARLKAVLDPLDMALGRSFMREEIPELFGETYNVGNWNVGHVALPGRDAHVLLVTINKQGKAKDHRYLDHWIDERTFHWQSQNSTKPESKRGQDIIWHQKRGIAIQLFVRETKLENGKGAPFVYYGAVRYKSHAGSGPMTVIFEVGE